MATPAHLALVTPRTERYGVGYIDLVFGQPGVTVGLETINAPLQPVGELTVDLITQLTPESFRIHYVKAAIGTPLTRNQCILRDLPGNYWRMEEQGAGALVDEMGQENGSISGATFGAAGQEVGTFALTTVSSGPMAYVNTGVRPQPGDDWSLELSVYGNPGAGSGGLVWFSNIPSGSLALGGGVQVWSDSGNVYVGYFQDTSNYEFFYLPAGALSAGWNHFAITHPAGGPCSFWNNGIPITPAVTASTGVVTLVPYNTSFCFGALDNGANALPAGQLFDLCAFWPSTELTEQQLLDHANGALA